MNNKLNVCNFLKITEKAKKQIINIIKNKNNKLLLYINNSGCRGYSYDLKLLDNIKDFQNIIIYTDKYFKIYSFKKDFNLIKNLKLDFIQENLNYKFIFKNNIIKNLCGCGKSFSK